MDLPSLGSRYRIERVLGRGGSATVYLAEDTRHHRNVAIKVLHPEVAAALGRERFLREIDVVARLAHPHIVPLHDSGAADDLLYYVMPYVDGETLRQRLVREGRLEPDEAVRITREIALGLEYAHRRGLVHRDVKPENVLLADGMALLTDFGIATQADPSIQLTTSGFMVGTPTYMAPEQILGRDVDARTDLYALACVLYEMLATEPPFRGEADSVLRQHVAAPPALVTDHVPALPAALADALAAALSKAPADRPASLTEFARGIADAIAPHAAVASKRAAASLPRPRTRFVGRERDLETLPELLAEERLVTITGIGGAGKTRVALEVAAGIQSRFPDGVHFVDLAPLTDSARVVAATAAALGVSVTEERELRGALLAHVASRTLLLLVDNCEHLRNAAAALVDDLLQAGAGVRVLATSREGLGVVGELLHPLEPLGVPRAADDGNPEAIGAAETVRLFVDRARLVDSGFAVTPTNARTVAEICRRLDGIPLAIELAAARVRHLSVEDIRSHLDDRFRFLTGGSRTALPRQQTLLATVRWSVDLLPAEEWTLLQALSPFAGSFPVELAAAVAGPGADAMDVLDRLATLVDKSLLQVERRGEATTWRLLETVRQYGRERLAEDGALEDARDAHAGAIRGLAARCYAARNDGDAATGNALEAQFEDEAAALAWFAGRDAEAYLDMAGLLAWFWQARSHHSQGAAHLVEALAATEAAPPRAARARALWGTGNLLAWRGERDAALARLEEALAQWRALDDRDEISSALEGLGWARFLRNEEEAMLAAFEEVLALARARGDAGAMHRARVGLAQGHVALSHVEAARALAREVVAYAAPRGDRRNEHFGWHFLADCALLEGRFEESLLLYRKSLAMAEMMGDRVETSFELQGIGMALAGLGAFDSALRLAAAAEAEWRRLAVDIRVRFWDALCMQHFGAARQALGKTATRAAEEAGRAMSFEEAIALGSGAASAPGSRT